MARIVKFSTSSVRGKYSIDEEQVISTVFEFQDLFVRHADSWFDRFVFAKSPSIFNSLVRAMPALVKYERKSLTLPQLIALKDYIKRKRLNEESLNTNGVERAPENGQQEPECSLELEPKAEAIAVTPSPPPAPSAKELREEKERSLNDVSKQLQELEQVLVGLKQKKHELFEEFKSLLSTKKSENESKKQAGERQMLGFPPPFMGQLTGQGTLTNVSPYRPGIYTVFVSLPVVHLESRCCGTGRLYPMASSG